MCQLGLDIPNSEKIEFCDSEWLTAKEKEKIYKNFVRVIDNKDISFMEKCLYKHLHLHCSFIAHYNIHGFMDEYSGIQFQRFLDHFKKLKSYIIWGDYKDINGALCAYVENSYNKASSLIYEQERVQAVNLVKMLIKKYNISVCVSE